MLRNYGKGAAGLTLFFDLLKTVISIFIAGIVFGFQYVGGVSISDFCYVAGIFVMLGHIFPLYYNFRGGKGVLVASTMALMLSPVVFAMLLLLFVAIVYLSRYVSLGSVTVGVLYPVVLSGYFSFTFGGTPMPAFTALSSIVLAIIIVWCHRKNLKRISERTENKISFGKKS
jgi:glycerol-3-phosphate acyltransferase PlsY